MKYSHDLIMQVKEFMERFNAIEISHKLHLDPYTVQAIIDIINNVTT